MTIKKSRPMTNAWGNLNSLEVLVKKSDWLYLSLATPLVNERGVSTSRVDDDGNVYFHSSGGDADNAVEECYGLV